MNKSILMLLASGLMISFTGCMTYPLNDTEIPYRVTHFEGIELKPNMQIEIQARNVYTDNWETIATTRSRYRATGELPILDPVTGLEFFQWETWPIWIAPQYWEAVAPSNRVKCQIRGLREDGRFIQTYNMAPDWTDKGALADYGESGNPDDFITLWSY